MPEDDKNVSEMSSYLDVIWRQLWMIIAVFFVVVISTLFTSLKMTPIYEATTTLRIEQRSPKVMTSINEVTPMGMGDYASYKDYYETQYKLIKSRSLLKTVATNPILESYGRQKSTNSNWVKAIKDLLMFSGEKFAVDPTEVILAKLEKAVKVRPVINSQLVKISVEDTSPKTAAMLVDLVAAAYVKQNLERSLNAADAAARWLTNAVEDQKKKLKNSEATLQQYRESHNINVLPQMVGGASVEEIKSEYAKLQAQYDNYAERYTSEHPKMIELKSQINSLRNKIQGLEDTDIGNKSMEYRMLEEEVQTNRRMYEALLGRFKEIDLSGTLNMNNITIVDRAEVPLRPIKPNLKMNMVLAMIVGLFGGLGVAYLFDSLDRTVKSTEDIAGVLKSHFLGAVHNITMSWGNDVKRDKIAHLDLFSPVSEAYRAIRTDILNLISNNGHTAAKAILVTSAEPRAGKTMTISNLAIVFAQQGYKVLLVDCDLRKPQVHRIYGLDNSAGLSDYLVRKSSLDGLIHQTEIENLAVIPSGEHVDCPAELLGSKRMDDFINEAKTRFNYIFLDTPPVISVTDSVVLADKADGAIYVVRSGKSSIHAALRVKELLTRSKTRLLGVILNDLNSRRGGYSNYYNYKYYHYYGHNSKRKSSKRIVQNPK